MARRERTHEGLVHGVRPCMAVHVVKGLGVYAWRPLLWTGDKAGLLSLGSAKICHGKTTFSLKSELRVLVGHI